MIYLNVKAKILSVDGTQKLLTEYKDTFTMIEDYSSHLHNGTLDTPKELDNAISELGSVYTSLTVVVNMTEGHKLLKEEEMKENKRQKIFGTDYTEVHFYREVRNIFKAYKDGCDKIISICQTKLKQIERERTLG